MRIVVAARDAAAQLVLGQIDFLLTKPRRRQHIVKNAEHFVRILLQAGERRRAERLIDPGFDRRRDVLQLLVKLIADLVLGATGAHHHTGHCGQADLVRGIEQIACTHQRRSAHRRQLVVLEQVQLHAIGQRERGNIRNLDGLERRVLQLFVGRNGGR